MKYYFITPYSYVSSFFLLSNIPWLYNICRKVLLQILTLQKLLLLQKFLAPPQLLVDFVTLCTIGAAFTLLLLGS